MNFGFKTAAIAACIVVACWAGYKQMQIDRGQKAFTRLGCANCHSNGGGPNLAYATAKYDADELQRFIQDPEQVYRARGKKPLNSGCAIMHKVKTTPGEVRAIAAFLKNVSN